MDPATRPGWPVSRHLLSSPGWVHPNPENPNPENAVSGVPDLLSYPAGHTMDSTTIQIICGILAAILLVVYLKRRRKRL